jgi:hypothetical protein
VSLRTIAFQGAEQAGIAGIHLQPNNPTAVPVPSPSPVTIDLGPLRAVTPVPKLPTIPALLLAQTEAAAEFATLAMFAGPARFLTVAATASDHSNETSLGER